MTTPKLTGGKTYQQCIAEIDEEIQRLAELVDQLSQPGIENGNRHKLKAMIMAGLLKQQRALNILKEIGQEAKQERKER